MFLAAATLPVTAKVSHEKLSGSAHAVVPRPICYGTSIGRGPFPQQQARQPRRTAMKHILFGTALAIGLATAPALAVEKPAKDQQSQALGEGRTDNMFKSEDGTLQGKPVVDGPADW